MCEDNIDGKLGGLSRKDAEIFQRAADEFPKGWWGQECRALVVRMAYWPLASWRMLRWGCTGIPRLERWGGEHGRQRQETTSTTPAT